MRIDTLSEAGLNDVHEMSAMVRDIHANATTSPPNTTIISWRMSKPTDLKPSKEASEIRQASIGPKNRSPPGKHGEAFEGVVSDVFRF
ncbi:uncharacterized protein PAC_14547 [Phialocephala subalpina]|uniref:Uncharacterized protein n=1 Tax=Phialocephala subalpina TaxID=576137 RepID=A0A1L7XHX4_9HELO|nr:uncharacterized protein PAC_14547 [Phialocephala subalpina]